VMSAPGWPAAAGGTDWGAEGLKGRASEGLGGWLARAASGLSRQTFKRCYAGWLEGPLQTGGPDARHAFRPSAPERLGPPTA
jgi:hypothetical protein